MSNSTMVVGKIDDQGDRVLLYPQNDGKKHKFEYYVIASQDRVKDLKVGDTIEYEPYGANFGWFVAKK
ncbi:MAG: hypothetical protein WCO10_02235 [bacterium]